MYIQYMSSVQNYFNLEGHKNNLLAYSETDFKLDTWNINDLKSIN